MTLRRFLPLFLLAAMAGCGYSATRLLPSSYQTIYVEPFENKIGITQEASERQGFQTNIPLLEEQVTRYIAAKKK